MPGIVADASVLAAIAFGEPNRLQALALVSGHEIHAPSLMAFEMTNNCLEEDS